MKIALFPAVPLTEEYLSGTLHPLGLLYLASYLRLYGKDEYHFWFFRQKIKSHWIPDYVFISSVTSYWHYAEMLAKVYHSSATKVIVGGPHITALPHSLTTDMDVAVLREAEGTIVDLLKEDCFNERIKGIAFRKNEKLIVTEPRPFIQDLDKIPFPARDLIPIRKNYWTGMVTSRGCPYNCIFCSSTRFWGKVRWHSAQYVVEEIREIVEVYGGNRIVIVDDLFTINKKRLKKVVSLLLKEQLDVEFQVNGRVNLISDEICKLLKLMGVTGIDFGFESNSAKTLRFLKGEGIIPQDNERSVRLCRKYNFKILANVVIGSPQETKEEILETLKFVKKSNLETLWVYPLTPLPATPLWEYAKSKGLVSDDMDFSKLDLAHFDKQNGVILSETLSRKEFIELYEMFVKESNKLKLKYLVKEGSAHPLKIPRYVWGKIKWM